MVLNRRSFFKTAVPATLFCAHGGTAFTQDFNPGYELGEKTYLSVRSTVLNETRTAEIIRPAGFTSDAKRKCEVIYILDGIRAYHYVAYDYLRGEGFIPKNTILVGLLGLRDTSTRLTDFTPTKVSSGSGGADRYRAFLKDELLPAINGKYSSDSGHSTLVGGSLGGLFVIHTFLNGPNLFKSYIALDPSLWWDHGIVNTEAKRKIDTVNGLNRILWVSAREGLAMHEMGIDQFQRTLRAQAPGDLAWTCQSYANETHLTTWIKGFWDGVRFCFGGYYANGITFKPRNGIVLKDSPFDVFCYQRQPSSYIRYTLDGLEPTLASSRFLPQNRLRLSKDTTLKTKAFCVRGQYDSSASGHFKVGHIVPALKQLEDGATPGGLRFKYYEGDWNDPPDVSQIQPNRLGRADSHFEIAKLPADATFVCVLEGFLRIDTPGYYIFELSDSGQSKVFVGDVQVIGDHFDDYGGATFMLPLSPGFHRFRAVYFHRKSADDLAPVYIKAEGEDDMPLPLEKLYSRI